MILDLRNPHRRIDWNRNCASVENPEEDREKVDARRQHDRNPVARFDVALDQAGGDAPSQPRQLPIGHCAQYGQILLKQAQMQSVRMVGDMPLQDVHQRSSFRRSLHERHIKRRGGLGSDQLLSFGLRKAPHKI